MIQASKFLSQVASGVLVGGFKNQAGFLVSSRFDYGSVARFERNAVILFNH